MKNTETGKLLEHLGKWVSLARYADHSIDRDWSASDEGVFDLGLDKNAALIVPKGSRLSVYERGGDEFFDVTNWFDVNYEAMAFADGTVKLFLCGCCGNLEAEIYNADKNNNVFRVREFFFGDYDAYGGRSYNGSFKLESRHKRKKAA